MTLEFLQYLILILIALLFADKYVPAILKKLGIKINGKNGNIKQEILHELETNHFHEVKEGIVELTREFRAFKEEMIRHNAEELSLLRGLKK